MFWNLETFEKENILEAHLETITALALTDDETFLASGSEDKYLLIFINSNNIV